MNQLIRLCILNLITFWTAQLDSDGYVYVICFFFKLTFYLVSFFLSLFLSFGYFYYFYLKKHKNKSTLFISDQRLYILYTWRRVSRHDERGTGFDLLLFFIYLKKILLLKLFWENDDNNVHDSNAVCKNVHNLNCSKPNYLKLDDEIQFCAH